MAIPYPTTLPKPLYSGYQNNTAQNFFLTEMDYASKRRAKYKGIYKIPFKIRLDSQQIIIFNSWYYNTLADGVKIFSATWNVDGLTTEYEFAFLKAPRKVPSGAFGWEITMEVELKTDIYELMAFADLSGFCPEAIECQDDFIAWTKTVSIT